MKIVRFLPHASKPENTLVMGFYSGNFLLFSYRVDANNLDTIFFRLPFYYDMKMVTMAYLMHPKTKVCYPFCIFFF